MIALCSGFALLLALVTIPAFALNAGQPAPPLTATLLDGRNFSLAEQRGKVVLINYWATWCEPCRAELTAFDEFLRTHASTGLTILAISMDDPEDAKKVAAIAATLSFPVAMADRVQAPGYGRVWRLPMSYVIDRDAVLRIDGGRGPAQVYDLPALQRAVEPLLNPATPSQKP